MLRFVGVTKQFANGFEALKDVNFCLEKGEMCFLTGHSGAGKSTLLKVAMMIEKITKGQLIVNGKNIKSLSSRKIPALRQSIGLILQNPLLLNDKTVFENVAVPLIISQQSPKEIAHRVRAALDKVGLLAKEKYLPTNLSAGEQQRVSIARAVVKRPTLLLADEPTGNLDPKLSNEILKIFEEFNQIGTTVLIATHDLGMIAGLQYPIYILKHGRLGNGVNHEL